MQLLERRNESEIIALNTVIDPVRLMRLYNIIYPKAMTEREEERKRDVAALRSLYTVWL